MTQVTTVLSDLGNVVVFFDNVKAAREIAALTGRTAAQVTRSVFRHGDLCYRYCAGELTTAEFLRVVRARLGVPASAMPDDAALGDAFADVFTPNEPVIERWMLLRRAGVVLTAVSNIEELRRIRLDRMGVLSLFDHLVMSYEERLMKPSVELMVRSVDRSAAKAEDCLFVDDLAPNLAPAVAIGVNAHQYSSVAALDACLARCGLADLIP